MGFLSISVDPAGPTCGPQECSPACLAPKECCPPGNTTIAGGVSPSGGDCSVCEQNDFDPPTEFKIIGTTCTCYSCNCDDLWSAMGSACKTYCCDQNLDLPDCKKCPNTTCVDPKSVLVEGDNPPATCDCECPTFGPCTLPEIPNYDTCTCACSQASKVCNDPNSEHNSTKCNCECKTGFMKCSATGLCIQCAKNLKVVNGKCECVDCAAGEETVEYNGEKYCCPPRESCTREPKDGNPCFVCCSDCGDPDATYSGNLTSAGTCVGLSDGAGGCKSCEACKANAERANGCNCKCKDGYGLCEAQERCAPKCTDPRVWDDNCVCNCSAADIQACAAINDCGLDENCICKTPPPCNLASANLINCVCVCLSTGAAAAADGTCPQQGPQGPVAGGGGGGTPPGGGGGDGGDGGDGGGGSCPPNASLGGNGKCYCNSPSAVANSTNSGCNCAPGYVFGADGVTCTLPDVSTPFIAQVAAENDRCSGVVCPPGQRCFETVFGTECKA